MLNRPPGHLSDDVTAIDERLAPLLDELASKLQSSDDQAVETFLRAHPHEQEELRRLIPTMRAMAEISAANDVPGSRSAELPLQTMFPRVRAPGARRLGDFRILRELGRGGMGIVYEAEQCSLARRVALKVLPFVTLINEKPLQRFKNEVRAAATLDHPNIVSVYSVGEESGIHYYAMQLVRGHTLAAIIEQLREQSRSAGHANITFTTDTDSRETSAAGQSAADQPEDHESHGSETVPQAAAASTLASQTGREFYRSVAQLGIQAAAALHYAHEQGIVHRDIKPANLMIDANQVLYVTDFGLATIEGSPAVTATGDLVGTLRYMAPEQALGQRAVLDNRVDVYSLAATLYELLTLRPLFPSTERRELLRQVEFDDPVPPRKIAPRIPRELEIIVMKALAKSPDDRYLSAAEMSADLRRFLNGEVLRGRPATLAHRVRKWSRRHQTLVMTAGIGMGLTIIGLSISTLLINRAWYSEFEQRRRAEYNLNVARQAVDQWYIKFDEEHLADQPGMSSDRHLLLQKALHFYEGLANTNPATPTARLEAAEVLLTLTSLRGRLGETESARTTAEQAIELLRELCKASPSDRDYRLNLARAWIAHLWWSDWSHESELEKRRSSVEKSLKLLYALDSECPNDDEIQQALCEAELLAVRCYCNKHHYDDADALFARLLTRTRSLVEDKPDDYGRLRQLHNVYVAGATLQLSSFPGEQVGRPRPGHEQQSVALFHRSLEVARELVKRSPHRLSSREALIIALNKARDHLSPQDALPLLDEAERESRLILEGDPELFHLISLRGQTLIYRRLVLTQLFRHEEALEALEKERAFLGLWPPTELLAKAQLLIGLGRCDEANTVLQQMIAGESDSVNRLDADIADVFTSLAEAYQRQGKESEAAAVQASRTELLQHAVDRVSTLIASRPQTDDIVPLLSERQLLFSRLDWDDRAFDDLSRIIELRPTDCYARYCRGLFYKSKRQHELALADFNVAKQDAGYRWTILRETASMLYRLMRYEEALADIDLSIRLHGAPCRTHHGLRARILHTLQRDREAVAECELEISCEDPASTYDDARLTLVEILCAGDPAVRDMERARQLAAQVRAPDNRSLAYGTLYLATGEYDRARQALLEHFAQPDTQDVEVLAMLALASAKEHDEPAAVEYYRRAVSEFPKAAPIEQHRSQPMMSEVEQLLK